MFCYGWMRFAVKPAEQRVWRDHMLPSATKVLAPIAIEPDPPRAALPNTLTWERQPEFTFDRLDAVDVVGDFGGILGNENRGKSR